MKNVKCKKRSNRSKGSVMIEMAVLSAIIAIGAMAATNRLGVRVRDAYCKVVGLVQSSRSGGQNFNPGDWSWKDGVKGNPGQCSRQELW